MAVRVYEMSWIYFIYLSRHLLEVRPPGRYGFSKEISHEQEVGPRFVSMPGELSVKMVLDTAFKSHRSHTVVHTEPKTLGKD